MVGSRGSALALVQTQLTIEKLRALFPKNEFAVMRIQTEGDRRPEDALAQIGGKGVFTREIEQALLADRIDLAVHSLKDLPTELPEGLIIGAVLERADPRDVLVSRGNLQLAELPQAALLGTDSPRRKVQLLAYRRDFRVLSLRGNVDTRLRKLDEGQYDAIVLAAAGLTRLGLQNRVTEYLSLDVMLPAPGQGVLAIEVREGDDRIRELIRPLDHAPTRAAITAERAFLQHLGGGCRVPIAAYAQLAHSQLHIKGLIASEDDTQFFRDKLSGDPALPEEIGRKLAARLMTQGAHKLLEKAP
jgi:hydroxymethylbilane synthase